MDGDTDSKVEAEVWRPVTLDLVEPVPDVATHGAGHLYVSAFLAGRPLGSVVVPAPFDPFPGAFLADTLRRRFAHGLHWAALEGTVTPMAPAEAAPPATVLICTRDRPDDLRRCLASVDGLEHPVLDVVVVDNGSTSHETRAVVEAAGALYVREPLPGLDRARNRGIAAARGEVVLLTDDDVEVDPRWADGLVACFADPLVMAATGLVLPARLDTPARRRFEEYGGFGRGIHRVVIDGTSRSAFRAGRAGAGASMAFRTRFLRSIGGFPEALDAGMPTASGGDTYALYRVLRDGFRIVYEPAAVAFHTHRSTEAELLLAVRGYGTGVYAYLAHAFLQDHDLGAIVAGGRWACDYLGRNLVRSGLGRPGARPWSLALEETKGALATPRRYRSARRLVGQRPPVLSPGEVDTRVWTVGMAGGGTVQAVDDDDLPALSVVIPSRGRRDSLVRLLVALDRQRYPDHRLQVVVALDGDIDGSEAAIASAGLRRSTTIVRLPIHGDRPGPGSGAATARNSGVEASEGDIVVFLDDDVQPLHDGVLLAHAQAHAGRSVAVIGPCPPDRRGVRDLFAMTVRSWWVDHSRRVLESASLTFSDVGSGNLSMPRSLFVSLGGFREMTRREDWELGFRLLEAGVELVAVPEAVVLHEAAAHLASALEDRRSEGAGDVAFARMHPGALAYLPLAGWEGMGRRRRRAVRFALTHPERTRLTHRPGIAVLGALATAGARARYAIALSQLSLLAYWSGVGEAAGGVRGWLELLARSKEANERRPRATLDLLSPRWSLPRVHESAEVEVRAHGLSLGRAPIGWGGTPWEQERFSARVLSQYGDAALRAEIRRSISP